MPGTYSQILLHVIFSTRHREPWITPDIAERLYAYIGGLVRAQNGVLYDIGGVEDHVHLYLRWRPDATVSDLMRTVKARSSSWVHDTFPNLGAFAWQEGYGVFSVSKSQEEYVKFSTGCAPSACRRSALHPWLHSSAPPGPKRSPPAQRRACMQAVQGRNTTPERVTRSILHRLGCRFGLHRADLPGKPDIVMPARRCIVLVHGCFWHGHACARGRRKPVSNAAYWRAKIRRNRARDRRTLAALRRDGWRVLVVWECHTRDPARLRRRLAGFVVGSRTAA